MAEAKRAKIERVVEEERVVLTLTQEEAQALRNVIGCSQRRAVDEAGLGGIFSALVPVTTTSQSYRFIIRKEDSDD